MVAETRGTILNNEERVFKFSKEGWDIVQGRAVPMYVWDSD
jgi:hypothetical protein